MRHADAAPRYLGVLLALNVTFLLVSDFTGSRIIAMFGLGVSVTVFYFPFSYLIGDVLTEVYGYAQARRVIWISMFCSITGSGIAKAQLLVPAASFFAYDPAFQQLFSPGVKVSVAGLAAFFAGDIANSYVLAKMKIWDQGRRLWARFACSTLVGEGVNTALFYGIALRGLLPGSLLIRGMTVGWAIKVLVEIAMLPVSYRVVRLLKQAENLDHYDYGTNFNPFIIR
ncbi:VUT family protein (plasmid) [Paraburkholderia pallida]|uniref:Queuosine precursor transporter n=1 Tax=Paraburkholderia pallida TaxID=2547399 RepID=A0A4P7D691_9BURK|nr:VUT family protein [Paraburkholderia pallida]